MRSLFDTYGLTHRSCAFIPPHKTRHGFSSGSRESHMDLDGKTALAGEAFHTIWGNELRYPGDPSAPAREVINCHCTLIPHVLLKGEKIPGKKMNMRKSFSTLNRPASARRFFHTLKGVSALGDKGHLYEQ